MPTMTLAVPEELKKRMDAHPEFNWSAIARQAFVKQIDDIEFLRKITKESSLTEQDVLELGRKVNASVAKKYLKLSEVQKSRKQ